MGVTCPLREWWKEVEVMQRGRGSRRSGLRDSQPLGTVLAPRRLASWDPCGMWEGLTGCNEQLPPALAAQCKEQMTGPRQGSQSWGGTVAGQRGSPRPEEPRSAACDLEPLYFGFPPVRNLADPLFWGSEGLVGNEWLHKSPHLLRVSPHL